MGVTVSECVCNCVYSRYVFDRRGGSCFLRSNFASTPPVPSSLVRRLVMSERQVMGDGDEGEMGSGGQKKKAGTE